jgi:hypothetical protein
MFYVCSTYQKITVVKQQFFENKNLLIHFSSRRKKWYWLDRKEIKTSGENKNTKLNVYKTMAGWISKDWTGDVLGVLGKLYTFIVECPATP